MTRLTHSLDEKRVQITMTFDDVTFQMTGVDVVNKSKDSVMVQIQDGKETVVIGGETAAIPIHIEDRRLIEAKQDGRRLGRPIAVSFPWFG